MPNPITQNVGAIVLAGGQGTRLFPLTKTRCKPAVCFGGKYRLIDIPLSNALNSGIDHIYVISQYFSQFLHEHIMESYPIDHTRDAKIHLISPEETFEQKVWYNGTADAIRQNLEQFKQTSFDYFLILSGDQLYNMNYSAFVELAKESDADLVIASLPVEEKEARRMGLLKVDGAGRVLEFYEKPNDTSILKLFELPAKFLKEHPHCNVKKSHYLGSMGIYIFKRKALFDLLEEEGDDFGRHLIPIQVKKGKTSAYVFKGYWEDIGTIGAFYNANIALTRKQRCIDMYDESNPIFTRPQNLPSPFIKDSNIRNSHICQGCLIEAKEISDSIIGVRCTIKKGSILRGCVVLGNLFYTPPKHHNSLPKEFVISENCHLENVILDEHAQIGKNVHLINKEKLQTYDGDGIYIRDGIIIVTTGAVLPDNFSL